MPADPLQWEVVLVKSQKYQLCGEMLCLAFQDQIHSKKMLEMECSDTKQKAPRPEVACNRILVVVRPSSFDCLSYLK